jgi:hypothetical protein
VVVLGIGNCRAQPAKDLAVAGGARSIRYATMLSGPASFCPISATPILYGTLFTEEPLLLLGCKPLHAARVLEIISLRKRADLVI